MFGLSRKTDYALLMLTALARRGGSFVSVRALAKAYRLSYRFAAEVVGALARAGMLESREGLKGGYRLARRPADITVRDVVRAMERRTSLVACLDPARKFACPQKATCPAHHGIASVERLVLDALANHTIADLVAARPSSARAPAVHA